MPSVKESKYTVGEAELSTRSVKVNTPSVKESKYTISERE